MTRKDRLRAVFAKFKSRGKNVGRQVSPQYRSDRELSESEYRSKHRIRRGAALGATAGATAYGIRYRHDPQLKEALRAGKDALRQAGEFIMQTGQHRGAATAGFVAAAKNKAVRATGKQALPYIAGGLIAGGLTRAITNPEEVQKIKPKRHVDQAIKRESSFRVRRVR